jgi:hypothetical protein
MSQIKVDTITDEAGTGAPNFSSGIEVAGQTLLMPASSALTTLSGSTVVFSGIPSTARRVTFMLDNMSTNGTVVPLIQLGDAGGIETTGYTGSIAFAATSGTASAQLSTGVSLQTTATAAHVLNGKVTFDLMDAATNLWSFSGLLGRTDGALVYMVQGSKALSATLTQLHITIGASTFDSGTASVSWE